MAWTQRKTVGAIAVAYALYMFFEVFKGANAAEPAKVVKAGAQEIARGRYLVKISACNDCHTVGFAESGGKLPEPEWLTGNPVGFQGPWGTTYPANLRLLAQQLDEAQWIARVRSPMRPPMPWFATSAMSDEDARALYRFVRSLGAKGGPAPAYVPPGGSVQTPYFDFVPKNVKTVSQ